VRPRQTYRPLMLAKFDPFLGIANTKESVVVVVFRVVVVFNVVGSNV